MALEKLSTAIEREYAAPYPDRKTALKHFQERYRVEKRGGSWWVDRSIRQARATGNARLDAIVAEVEKRKHG